MSGLGIRAQEERVVVSVSLSEINVGEHSHENFLAFYLDIQQICWGDVEG